MTSPDRNHAISGFPGPADFATGSVQSQAMPLLHARSPKSPGQWSKQLFRPDREGQIKKGADCLSLLHDLHLYDDLIRSWHTSTTSLIRPWVLACMSSLNDGLCKEMATCSNENLSSILLRYSARIFANNLQPLNIHRSCTMDQFSGLITGPNLRWESVGILFVAISLGIVTQSGVMFGRSGEAGRNGGGHMARQMLEASQVCLSFCDEFAHMTDPELWLRTESTQLYALLDGDASYISWLRAGDLISICCAKGLHGQINVSPEVPFWMSELRKQVFATTYKLDKEFAMLMSLPPRLSRRYCSMQLPLDLDTEQLRLPEPQLELLVEKLDQDGWNRKGEFQGTLSLRASLICAMVVEDILELTLSTILQNEESFARTILHRSQLAWNALPSFITKSPPLYKVDDPRSGYMSDSIRLRFRHNEIQIHRWLVQRGHGSNQELIRLSQEVLSTVMRIVYNQRSGKYAWDMPWVITSHALPVAGILSLELLRHSQRLPVASSFHRSEVIQNLSSLIATLRWIVSNQAANYEICGQAQPVLQKILDKDLSGGLGPAGRPLRDGRDMEGMLGEEQFWLAQAKSESEFWALMASHPLLADGGV